MRIIATSFLLALVTATASAQTTDTAVQDLTLKRILLVGTAMMSWLTDNVAVAGLEPVRLGDYSKVTDRELSSILVPQYMAAVPETDGWGNTFEYYLKTRVDPVLPRAMMLIRSPGSDGLYSGTTYMRGQFSDVSFGEDLVWADGAFVRWPARGVKPLPVDRVASQDVDAPLCDMTPNPLQRTTLSSCTARISTTDAPRRPRGAFPQPS